MVNVYFDKSYGLRPCNPWCQVKINELHRNSPAKGFFYTFNNHEDDICRRFIYVILSKIFKIIP